MEELVAAADKRRAPGAVRVEERFLQSRPVSVRARRGLAHRRGFGEDLLHPRVGRERLALLDADGGQQAQCLRIDRVGGFLLHDLVDFLEERAVHRVNRVEGLPETLTKFVAAGSRPAPADRSAGAA